MLNASYELNKKSFNEEHDVFGDVYMAMGDLARKEKQSNLAKEYYSKALQIYLAKFDEHYFKVHDVKGRISK